MHELDAQPASPTPRNSPGFRRCGGGAREGQSLHTIARQLNAERMGGRRWYAASVRYVYAMIANRPGAFIREIAPLVRLLAAERRRWLRV